MPLSRADFSTSASTSASSRTSRVVVMTNCTGGPPTEPGSAGGEKAMACAVAMLEMRGSSSCQHLLLGPRPLAPRLEQDAGEALMHVAHAVDGEDVLLLRHRGVDLVELLGRVLEIVEIGVLRRLHQGEQDALVLLRRELPLRGHIHEPGRGDDASEHEQRHRTVVEACRAACADSGPSARRTCGRGRR